MSIEYSASSHPCEKSEDELSVWHTPSIPVNNIVSMQIVDTFEDLPKETFDYMTLSTREPINYFKPCTLTHSELDVQLIKHICKILVSPELAIPPPFQTKGNKPARCANALGTPQVFTSASDHQPAQHSP